eukprot:CAMPEP_0170469998 /NCGR_PEP_ID=MMETSP0123-20130129/12620_1 /TAXON_ID=182087 /ORGANISM="Favella ehrenbergii, Strain Fehren 1" /LENGTH=142 /DNA_ID=CAMNT_0010737011 /DNA_START=578 /DNA_END=1006 /DNA_ORIENTATION=-
MVVLESVALLEALVLLSVLEALPAYAVVVSEIVYADLVTSLTSSVSVSGLGLVCEWEIPERMTAPEVFDSWVDPDSVEEAVAEVEADAPEAECEWDAEASVLVAKEESERPDRLTVPVISDAWEDPDSVVEAEVDAPDTECV